MHPEFRKVFDSGQCGRDGRVLFWGVSASNIDSKSALNAQHVCGAMQLKKNKKQSPNKLAPTFQGIASAPGMTSNGTFCCATNVIPDHAKPCA
jgi:hypothetical protein